ncbi:hypothetical protein SteCoe_3403 [Stentor coeruleus]|uniref:Uncharacterized protein n=1 Tax=Stentor coeruleus TaxID=5963 RepID=A0A1R2CX30_9CILI|nr:hypothetical protein SteCoe_3403 [Stentor coeruleus]
MKHTKLAPNANYTKEWEGYMKSWKIRKAQKAKKRAARQTPSIPSNPQPKPVILNDFSLQEIKIAALKHTMNLFPCFKDIKA